MKTCRVLFLSKDARRGKRADPYSGHWGTKAPDESQEAMIKPITCDTCNAPATFQAATFRGTVFCCAACASKVANARPVDRHA